MRQPLTPIAVMLSVLCLAAPARADDDDVELYARVIVDSTVIRSGPGVSYRRLYVAERGDVFPVVARSTRGGYWFQVELPDGTSGWILGDTVYNHEVGEDDPDEGRFLPGLFAPPPLPTATGELSVTFGILGRSFGANGFGGFMAVRPTIYVRPSFGLEVTAAASVSTGGRVFLGTIGGIINVFPESPVVPYVVAGGGVALSAPNSDTFLFEEGTTGAMYGGGGLRFGFKYRLTLRIEARAWAFYEADRYVAQEELSGGITVFF